MKYVMTRKGPILFPDTFNHSDFALYDPISAGTVVIPIEDYSTVKCVGESVTLKMHPGKEDNDRMRSALHGH